MPETERPEKRPRESATSKSSDDEEKPQTPRELEDNKREEGEYFGDMLARQEEADRTPKAEMETHDKENQKEEEKGRKKKKREKQKQPTSQH